MARLSWDPEFRAAIAPLLPAMASAPKFLVGDVLSRRTSINQLFSGIMERWPPEPDIEETVYQIPAQDGAQLALHRFVKVGVPTSASAVYYTHGGGYFALSVPLYRAALSGFASQSAVQFFAIEYRMPPEHPFPTPLEDCYAGLAWLSAHAGTFGVDPARIALMGDSAGGGLCAGLAIAARDRALMPPPAKQLVIAGMLDDRNRGRFERLAGLYMWTPDDNLTGWRAYVGEKAGGEERGAVSPYAAASRVESVEGLPALYVDVPGLDIFRDENLAYAARFAAADIETEVHVYPGVPHSFEAFAPRIYWARMAMANRVRAIRSV